jgi:hypothetical protein
MLPILRIITVGGVFLAITILVLSLAAPDGSREATNRASGPAFISARGALMQIGEHPEWRQFIIQAALRRADELAHLRELADDPVAEAVQVPEVKIAVLPVDRIDAEPEDITGTINVAPAATMPIEIGEASSVELPVAMPEERSPVVLKPIQVNSKPVAKLKLETKKKFVRRMRRPKPPVKPEPAPLNIFEAIFGISPTRQASAATAPSSQPATGRADTATR